MTDWSSEKIAKALKGSGFTPTQRISTATDAWNNDKIFFPNKDDFLFDWLCLVLTAKPNLKSLSESPLFMNRYWQLLTNLFKHYTHQAQLKGQQQFTIPFIRTPLLVTVSTVLQHIYSTFKNENALRRTLVRDLLPCIQILMSDTFRQSYHPTLEQMTTLVENLLMALSQQIKLVQQLQPENEDLKDEVSTMDDLVGLAQVLLKRYDDQLIQAGNQKKVYATILTKLLPIDLHVRRQLIAMTTKEGYYVVAQQLTDILCNVLFHADTILEYTSVLKEYGNNNSNIKNASYVSKVFEELSKAVNNSTSVESVKDALCILPILLSQFIKAFREKRHTKTAPTQDLNRQVEFAFFMQAYNIMEMAKAITFDHALEIESQLLEQVLVLNIYSARNDDIAKQQYEFLDSLGSHVVEYLENGKAHSQCFVFDIANYLLQIDISLIESRMVCIWPALLQPLTDSGSCISLARSVLKTYAASRQIDVFVDELLNAIAAASFDDVYDTLKKPLFTKVFLKEFSSIVAKYVPAPQTLTIFERFAAALKTNLVSRKSVFEYDADLSPTTKKAKLDGGNQQIENRSGTMLVTTYLVEFIKSLRIGHHQRQAFELTSIDLFEQYLSPSLCSTMDIAHCILPALQVHFALSNAFYDVYWSQLSKSSRERVVFELKSLLRLEYRGKSQAARMFLVQCASVLLQHVYFSTLSSVTTSSTSENADMVAAVLNMVMDENETKWQSATWDGQLVSLKDMDSVRLAVWKLVTDEWLEPVCRIIQHDSRQTQRFTYLVLLSTINQKPVERQSTTFTMQSLNTVLLRSANFYEIQCFSDLGVNMILKMLVQLFQDKTTQCTDVTTNIIGAEIAKVELDTIFVQDRSKLSRLGKVLVDSLSKTAGQHIDYPMQSAVDTICRLMNLLLLFPVEYFGKQERSHMLWLALLIDAWLFLSCGDATPCSIVRGSLACRSLYLRFVNIISAGALEMDSSILHWWVHVLDIKFTEDTIRSIKPDVNAWTQVTKLMDNKVQSIVLSMAAAKHADGTVTAMLQHTLRNRFAATANDENLSSSFKWTLSFMDALVGQLPSLIKKHGNIADSNILGTLPEMIKVSQFICNLLQQGNQTLESDVHGMMLLRNIPDSQLAALLHGANLVLDYARILKLNDKEIDVTELSEIVTKLASPMVSHLQHCLLSQSNSNMDDSLNLAVSFVGAVCMTLSHQDQTLTTKRILSVVWVVIGLAHETRNSSAIQSISDVFSKWIYSLPQEQYSILVAGFAEQSKSLELEAEGSHGKKAHHTFVSLMFLLLTKSNDGQKRQLVGMIPTFVLKLTSIVGSATNIDFMTESLDLLVRITNSNIFINNAYDVSLVLFCLLQILEPSTYSILWPQMDRNLAHSLFGKICFVLVNLVRLHRDPLSENMGSMVALLQHLLQCFKSSQLSLVSHKKDKNTKKRKASGTAASSSSSAPEKSSLTGLLSPHMPLDSTAAERYARICSQFTTKSSGSKRSDMVQQNIAKHVPYLLMNYFVLQSDPIANITQPALKNALSFGWYELMDICTASDRTIIMSSLNPTGQSLFKSFYGTWKSEHKYSGQ